MKERKNTIDDVLLNYMRRSGNTIRQIDAAIQLLYNGYIVEVKDHWENGKNKRANIGLFLSILKRLECEHNLNGLIEENKIRIDRNKCEIELL